MVIKFKFGWEYQLGKQFIFIRDFLKEYPIGAKDLILDFHEVTFIPPFISVFFSAFIEKHNFIKIQGINMDSYHATIEFPYGFKPDLTKEWRGNTKI